MLFGAADAVYVCQRIGEWPGSCWSGAGGRGSGAGDRPTTEFDVRSKPNSLMLVRLPRTQYSCQLGLSLAQAAPSPTLPFKCQIAHSPPP